VPDDAPPFRPRRPAAVRVAAVVAGTLVGLLALCLVSCGGVALWGEAQKDDQGYVSTASEPFRSDGYALATRNLSVGSDVPGFVVDDGGFGDVRLRITPHGDGPVFVGVAPTADVARYLRGTPHSSIRDVSYSPFRVDAARRGGDRRPAPPAAQRFWAAAAQGPGPQTVTWDVQRGDWSVVVMNADGSRGVDTRISAGARLRSLSGLGWAGLGGGAALLLAAGGLYWLAMSSPRPRRVRRPAPGIAVISGPAAPTGPAAPRA
jgi:hypothetical protein